jgi:DNA-binding transcriptional regulator/RsmH inhibitor MraZ
MNAISQSVLAGRSQAVKALNEPGQLNILAPLIDIAYIEQVGIIIGQRSNARLWTRQISRICRPK